MDTRIVFTLVVGFVAVARIAELVASRRNERRLRARGGREFGARHYPWMVMLHTSFLISGPAEVWLLDRPARPIVTIVAAAVLAVATVLRIWVLRTLRGRWTARVIVVTGDSPVIHGPYRLLRHPNYVAVALEIASIPMLHGAWLTALVFSAANAVVLGVRISAEETALRRLTSYEAAFPRNPGGS